MRKALVTGAAGFIGSNLVRELLEEGVEVRAMILPGEDTRNLVGVEVERVDGNVLDPSTIESALAGCDTLFHLAAIYSIFVKDRSRFYDVNLQGSRNVLWAAKRADVEKVVYTSSIAALGVEPGHAPANEDTPFNQYHMANDYVLTKYLSQEEALTFAREGMPLVVVNPCFPYGEGDLAPTPTGKFLVDCAGGMQFMCFEGGINVVDVKDVARGHMLAAKKGRNGEKYLLGNANVTIQELFEMAARAAGLNTRFIKMPMPLVILYGHLLTKWAGWSGNQPITTAGEVKYSNQYLFADTTKAREELGLEPSPIEESVSRAVDWFKREGYIPQSGPWSSMVQAASRLTGYLPPPR